MRVETAVASTPVRDWQRIVVASTAGIGLVFLALLVAIGIMIPVIIVFGAIFLVVAALLARFGPGRRWPWVVVGALTAFFLVANLPFLIHDLSHPEEPFLFIPNVLALALSVLVVVGAVAVAWRPSIPSRPLMAAAGGISAVAIVASIGASMGVEQHEQQPGDVHFLTTGGKFPERLEVGAGPQWIFLDNEDRFRHTFVIDEPHVKIDMPGSTGRRAEINLPAGEYRYWCDVPGHESMEGVLVVSTR